MPEKPKKKKKKKKRNEKTWTKESIQLGVTRMVEREKQEVEKQPGRGGGDGARTREWWTDPRSHSASIQDELAATAAASLDAMRNGEGRIHGTPEHPRPRPRPRPRPHPWGVSAYEKKKYPGTPAARGPSRAAPSRLSNEGRPRKQRPRPSRCSLHAHPPNELSVTPWETPSRPAPPHTVPVNPSAQPFSSSPRSVWPPEPSTSTHDRQTYGVGELIQSTVDSPPVRGQVNHVMQRSAAHSTTARVAAPQHVGVLQVGEQGRL
ncbi:hypothetical protein BDZ91DRAFT_765114 [Kalaharituber pfeilii]|nr:hypothetical protein BDZ91DRAFT_765114 [Kalaharituber pfeilii]